MYKRLPHPARQLQNIAQQLDDTEQRLELSLGHVIKHKQSKIELLYNNLCQHNPVHKLEKIKHQQFTLTSRLFTATQYRLEQKQAQLQHLAHNLNSVSPLATLNRGYAIVTTTDDNKLIQSSAQLRAGQKVKTRLAKGSFFSIIEHTES